MKKFTKYVSFFKIDPLSKNIEHYLLWVHNKMDIYLIFGDNV